MSNQPNMSQQPASTSSHDWSQAANEDLEVHMSDSEGTERAKEAEKSRWEAAKRERRVEAHCQKAEEARLEQERKEREEHERQEQERREQEEHEMLEREEQERQEALAAAWRAAVAEVEAVQQNVTKEKGHVGELQSESRGSSVGSSGQVAAYSPMTGASMGMLWVAPTVRHAACDSCKQQGEASECRVVVGSQSCGPCRKRKKKCSWAMAEEAEAEAAVSGSRKWAGTGGSRGSGRKKGQTNEEDDDDEIEEVPGPAASHPEASGLGLVGEESEFGGSGQGVPGPVYDERMLMIQARQAAAMERQVLMMERMAGAMEVQAVAVHVYVQRQPVFLPWPPGGLVGAAPVTGQAVAGGSGSGTREERAAPEWSETTVGGEVSNQGREGDAEGGRPLNGVRRQWAEK
ncbi:hypothetical protein EDD16DRAFT_1707121 [Pisolithus croceorrhizus]|nr:hypothetical protein EV401DRAFT_2083695 [Pisolithus croceorrhizus]KAI6118899.1 hypothetical protein EDD16DRAFT_1707121 [Pisolithus croceorrhizus]